MVLIITGTIAPVAQNKLALQNATERLQQYIDCIRCYLDMPEIQKIVFCDNSDYDTPVFPEKQSILQYAKDKQKQFEWMSFQGDAKAVQTYGKGYGEGEIMEYVLSHSELLKADDYLIKVTGRLVVDNLGKIVSKIDSYIQKLQQQNQKIGNQDSDVSDEESKTTFDKIQLNSSPMCFINIPNKTRRDIFDTRLYAMPKALFQQYFQQAYRKVNDAQGYFLEHAYKDTILDNHIASRNFPLYPRLRGISGTSGDEYVYTEWKCRIKDLQSKFNYYGKIQRK